MSQYPEHEKLKAIKANADVIASFLEWVEAKGMFLAKLHSHTPACGDPPACGYWDDPIEVVRGGIESLLARYFDIDLNKIDEEKNQMLEELREINGRM